MIKFEDRIDTINSVLNKKRYKWNLDSISYMDFSDVSQIIRLHIYIKWSQWDQVRPLERWLGSLIERQIINIIRNNYGKFTPPCTTCKFSSEGNGCEFTKSGIKDVECPAFKKWAIKKKDGYNMQLAVSMENEDGSQVHSIESSAMPVNIDDKTEKFHAIMMHRLPDKLKVVYKILYIEGGTDEDVANHFHLICSEKNRKPGYKQISNYKMQILKMAKLVLAEEDIFP